jgi:hypothetical protein
MVLTQRVRAPLLDRRDLWTNIAVQPFVVLLLMRDLPLATGGHISCAAHNLDALVGPEGWLPDVPVFSLIALELHEGRISVRPVDNDELPDLAQQQRAREVVARHYRKERWWRNEDDLESRPGELVRALTLARLEDPGFLTTPLPPLDELLYDPLEQEVDRHHWRDFSACQQGETVSFQLNGMPEALHQEVGARAQLYGMSFDQYVIAVLGHLAWRTPFAEDMEPWEGWDPESRPPTQLRGVGGSAVAAPD